MLLDINDISSKVDSIFYFIHTSWMMQYHLILQIALKNIKKYSFSKFDFENKPYS